MTSITDHDWRAERSAELAEECRMAFEDSIDFEAIAKAWSDEICDTHPEARRIEAYLAGLLSKALDQLYSIDDEAKIGATLGVCMGEDEFNSKWYADRRTMLEEKGYTS